MNTALAESLFIATRIVHISAGAVALFVGPGAMLTVKGARWHRTWGKIFVGAMTTVAASAVPMAFYHPSPFLGMVAIFSFYLAFSGWRVLRPRKAGVIGARPAADWIDAGLSGSALVGGAVLLMIGGRNLMAGNSFGLVALAFGIIGIVLALSDARDLWNPRRDRPRRISAHIGRMGGAYIATVTAFFAVNIHFLPAFVVWLLPTVVGLPLILRAIRARRKKLTPRPAVS